jgi:hypothetical protein
MTKDVFAPCDPETAQRQLTVEQYANLLGKLKPNFIHHSESKMLMRDIFDEMGSDLERTYFDVPILPVRSIAGSRFMIFS